MNQDMRGPPQEGALSPDATTTKRWVAWPRLGSVARSPASPSSTAAPPRRRARAARVPHMWPGRARLRAPLVRHVSDQRALPVFLPGPELLSVTRKEEAAPVGGVVAEGSARAGPASSRRPHHATPPPRSLPQASRARSRTMAPFAWTRHDSG